MPDISLAQLIDLAEGRLPPGDAASLRRRIAADPSSAAELAAFEELIGLMRSDESVDAPEHVIARAARLVRPQANAPSAGILTRILATLRSDSWQRPLAAGLRSGQSGPRSLTYSAEAWDLDLQITRQAGGWQLRGQLLGPELAGSVALRGGASTVTTVISELGEFGLPPVEAGTYALYLSLGEHEIVVSPVELGP